MFDALNNLRQLGTTPLLAAIWGQQISVVRILHEAGAKLNKQTSNGLTPLIVACHNASVPIVEYLIQNNCLLDIQDEVISYRCLMLDRLILEQNGSAALIHASQAGHTAIVKMLIEAGASIDITNTVLPRWIVSVMLFFSLARRV